MKINTPDDWARIFKLHNCIGNKKFAEQVKQIQQNVIDSLKETKPKKP